MAIYVNMKLLHGLSSNNPIEEYTEVKESKIQGYGLFAKKLILKGTVLWHARAQDVLILHKEQFLTLANSFRAPASSRPRLIEPFIRCILKYSYFDSDADALVFCLDNARYMNHSRKSEFRGG